MQDNRPHFVFVSPYTHGNVMSGARRRTTELCKALQKSGLARVTLVSPWRIDPSVDHILFNTEGGHFRRVLKYIKLLYLLRNFRDSYIISENPIAPLPLHGNRVLHVIHDAKFATEVGRRGKSIASLTHKVSSRICDRLITVSKAEKARLSEVLDLDLERIIVSHNGLSEEWFRTSIKTELKYDILYVSNFARHKNHLSLLKACVGEDWRIAFVGSDMGTLQACKNYALENNLDCHFFSKLSDDALIDVYDASRIFVFPSKLEGFGIPFVEARSRGLCVVANSIEVFRTLAESLQGTLVDFEDPAKVKKAILQSLKVPKARPESISNYRWETIAKDLVQAVV